MIICSPEPKVKILVDRDPIKTSFKEWAKPGHFSRTIAKGPKTTTWIWNLHAMLTTSIAIPVIWRRSLEKYLCPFRKTLHHFSLAERNVFPRCSFFQL
ncbi:hypothetical protein AB3S75_037375 [Citrus x aurantiifolia]